MRTVITRWHDLPADRGRSLWSRAFVGITVGNFIVLLDATILTVALPDIQRDLHGTDAQLAWASVGYTVAFAGFLLAAGAVADRFGTRRLYLSALVGFSVVSLLCAAAPSIGFLIAARSLLGVTAACLVPSSVALLTSLYPNAGARTRAVGLWSALSSVGLLAGPLIGGALVAAGGWRWIFLVNPAFALTAILLARRLSTPKPSTPRPIDLPGIGLSMVTLGFATYGFIDAGTNGWTHPAPIIALCIAAIAAVLLVIVERRVLHPVLPPALFARPAINASILAAAVASLIFYGLLFTLTLWYQREHDLSPLGTGIAFIPMMLPMCVMPFYTGKIVARFGATRLITLGLSCDILAGLLLVIAGHAPSTTVIGWLILAELALVAASTTTIPAATAVVAVTARTEYAASAQGALNAGRQAASALGVAIVGQVLGLHTAGWIITAIAVVATLTYIILARPRTESEYVPSGANVNS